jgi:dTDP-4-amino-4,6-dideoxygalactose transaminase
MTKIPFTMPTSTGLEGEYINKALSLGKLSGDGYFTKKCQLWFESYLECNKALLTPSCTAALEMAAILIDIQPGDEVILPSYTFVSTANAFVLRGAKLVFVDIRSDTMNIDENLIEEAVTSRTKAIVPVHYAGVPCEMDAIMSIAKKYKLFVIEDAAQGMMSTYKGKPLGSIGHIGTFSFHDTKNYTSGGEGGLLIINDKSFEDRSDIIREKGTNRSRFVQGMVDKYTWVDIGSSYLPSELQAAYLYAQLKNAEFINDKRIMIWEEYNNSFSADFFKNIIDLPFIPQGCKHNGHMFFLKLKDNVERCEYIDFMDSNGVTTPFHYIPLHSSPSGKFFGRFNGKDNLTTIESEKLVRLPLYYNMCLEDVSRVISLTIQFFDSRGSNVQ